MADTYLPRALKNANHVSKLNPLNSLEKSSRGKFGLKSKCRACISEKKQKRTQQAQGAEVKTQNNRTYRAENKTELAEKMRVKRAKEKIW